ncbi:helix-turn-helix transcriptional regulator [Apibacter raozihei]|uniref:helix-turn-helix transcriptional regulator n=1 Tax=Apibacter raozihei TaxID=2500547 RepID=UPI000FE2C453|nr:helix-turn-helix transcriptional regulator [Apibacter raozihei]
MKFLFFIFFFIFIIKFSYTQKNKDSIDNLIDQTGKLDFSNTIKADQAIIRLKSIYNYSKKIHYDNGVIESGNYIIIFYYRKGQYEKVINLSSDIEQNVNFKNIKNNYSISKFYRFLSLSYMKLGFNDEGLKQYKSSVKYANKIKDKDFSHFSLALLYYEKSIYLDQNNKHSDSVGYYLFKTLDEVELIKDKDLLNKFGNKIFIYNALAHFFLYKVEPSDTAMAYKYFTKAKNIYENSRPSMLAINRIEMLLNESKLNYLEKKYEKAAALAKKSLEIEKKQPTNSYQRKRIYEILAKSYLETGNIKESKKYMDLFAQTTDSLDMLEKTNIQIPIDKIIQNKQKEHFEKNKQVIIILSVILIIIFILIYIKFKQNQKKTHENYKRLLIKLQENNLNSIDIKVENNASKQNPIGKSVTKIADETANQIILKLDRFEQSLKFLKKDISLTTLAHSLNTNPKYLSELIKETKSKSFNKYINGLRINYITKKLFESTVYRQYKIKYLAEECGYSSPQVFVLAFKNENGVTPSYYIEQLKKDDK